MAVLKVTATHHHTLTQNLTADGILGVFVRYNKIFEDQKRRRSNVVCFI